MVAYFNSATFYLLPCINLFAYLHFMTSIKSNELCESEKTLAPHMKVWLYEQ